MITPKTSHRWYFSGLFLSVFAALVLLRLFMISRAQLFPDEALYYFLAVRAPSNFCPHPPGTPLLTWMGTMLFGKTELGARAFSFLLGMATLFPVVALARQLGGRVAGAWSLVALATTPIFVMFGVITTPDGTQLFLYALLLLVTWNAMARRSRALWALAGLIAGVGLFVKYVIIIYFPALALCLLITPEGRRHLKTPGPYIACLVAFFVFMPVFLISEWSSGWAAMRYHLSRRQRFTFPTLETVGTYQLAHIGYYSPLLYGLYLYAMVTMARRAAKAKDAAAAFLASFSLVPWALFAAIAAVTERELSREQWDAIAYVPALIASGVLLSQRLSSGEGWRAWPRLNKTACGIGAFIILVVAVEGSGGWISAAINRKPLFSNLTGWRAMAAQADEHLAALPSDAPKLLVGESFAPTLQYFFYSPSPAKAISIWSRRNEKYGLEDVLVSAGAGQMEFPKHLGSNAVFVMEEDPRKPNLKHRQNRVVLLQDMYERVEPISSQVITKSGRPVKAFRYYRCLNLTRFTPQG